MAHTLGNDVVIVFLNGIRVEVERQVWCWAPGYESTFWPK